MAGSRKFFIQLFYLLLFLPVVNCKSASSNTIITDDLIYENWLLAVDNAYSVHNGNLPGFEKLSDFFLELYRKTNEQTYLRFSLYEAGRQKREEIIDQLTNVETESLESLILLLRNGITDTTDYKIRAYSFDDIYLFLDFDIPTNFRNHARELLDYWFRSLPEYYQYSYIKGSFVTHSLILGYYRLGEHQKVYEVSRYLQNSNPFPDSAFSLELFLYLSHSLRISGYYLDALRLYQEILLPIALNLNDMQRYYEIRMDYAFTQLRIGNVNIALTEYQEIYSNLEMLKDTRYRTALFNNLAICYLNAGRFDQYIAFQLDAYHIAQNNNDIGQQIMILRNLFIFYQRQNETELALSYLEQALLLAKDEDLSTDVSSILIALGIHIRSFYDDYLHAIDLFYEALKYSQSNSIYQQIFNSKFEIAQTFLIFGDYENSEKYISKLLEISKSRNDDRGYILTNILLANSYIKSGRTVNAGSILNQFSEIEFQQLPFEFEVLAHNINTQFQIFNENYRIAIDQSTKMISKIINWLAESSNQETGHMRMDDEFNEAFRLHLNLLESLNRPQDALITIGDLRNITRSGFYNNPLLKSQLLSEEELIRDYQLSNRIRQLRSQYANASGEQRVYVGNELLAATSERNTLLNRAFPQHRETPYESALRTLRRQLGNDQMVFYFSVFDGQIFSFTITRRNVEMKTFPKDELYLNMINNAVSSLGSGQTNLNALYNVYTTFFKGEIPKRIRHVYFIPDGSFYRLPLEILPVTVPQTNTSYGTVTYFVENYSVSYANSLSDIIHKPNNKNQNFQYDIAGFGIRNFTEAGHPELMNLPSGPVEIVKSADALSHFPRKRVFLESESTPKNFREMAGSSRILHIATHSKVNNDNPLFSTLYMYNGQNDMSRSDDQNGIIHAYELFDLNLNADLIFLSSCESGSGGYLQGSGILGFSRAFSYAGAQSLALNLWPIRDQTAAEIAVKFYEGLNFGNNKAEALRNAQISYLNHSNSDPYLWGAFVLYGDISPLISTKGQFNIAFLILFLVIVACSMLYRVYR